MGEHTKGRWAIMGVVFEGKISLERAIDRKILEALEVGKKHLGFQSSMLFGRPNECERASAVHDVLSGFERGYVEGLPDRMKCRSDLKELVDDTTRVNVNPKEEFQDSKSTRKFCLQIGTKITAHEAEPQV